LLPDQIRLEGSETFIFIDSGERIHTIIN